MAILDNPLPQYRIRYVAQIGIHQITIVAYYQRLKVSHIVGGGSAGRKYNSYSGTRL